MNKKLLFYSLPIIAMLIVVFTGWLATDYLGNKVRQEIIRESRASALTIHIYVTSSLNYLKGAVKSMSGSPFIAPALISESAQDIERANSALDRYNSALNASVSYLIDTNGQTVASSNRHDPDSFVGKSYLFRPYFQEAIKGNPYSYFAMGITSEKRGFYTSCPVKDSLGKVIGVVTMKKNLDDMEVFLSRYPLCFLISKEGIIFLSSRPEMAMKSFWPLDNFTQEKLIASQQFCDKPFKAVLDKEINDGMEISLESKNYYVSRLMIENDGWSIVLLSPTERIWAYRIIGILATIFVFFLITVLSGIIYLTEKSRGAIRQSEESKRLLLNAAGEGIFGVDTEGKLTFVNPTALRMVGFSEEEMLGKKVHSLIHHTHLDGTNYPLEDCPMYASYTKGDESLVTEEVLWRKNGSNFSVEYTTMPIISDSNITGAVVTFRDITIRKQAEAKVREMAYHDFLTELPNRKLFSDRLNIALNHAQRNKKELAIAMLDLDNFKNVNDSMGHEIGDLLLRETALRLRAELRKGDTVARMGGDEFILILPDLKGIDDATLVAQKIINRFSRPFILKNHNLIVTISIGISIYPRHGLDEVMLVKNADIAMYQAKQAGRACYQIYKNV